MVISIKIEIGHQFCFYIIHRFTQGLDEFIKVFFVKENFMPIIPVIIKPFAAFGYSQVIIIASGCSYIKKIGSSFTSTNSLAVNALHFIVIILVSHSFKFLQFNNH